MENGGSNSFQRFTAEMHLALNQIPILTFVKLLPSKASTMDYTSNTEDMDMYVEASGRAIDSKGDVVMMAELY